MNRRDTVFALLALLALLALGAAPPAVEAQQAARVHRIGVLSAPARSNANIEALRQGLRDHGYVEGRELRIEWRFADGSDDKLPQLAAELAGYSVDVIVTIGGSAAIAAKKATTATPIVFTALADPVAFGLVRTLARPDGNLTGLAALQTELTGKRIELLKEAIPSLKSIAMLVNPGGPASAASLQEARIAARRLALDVRVIEARHPVELESALTTIARERTQAVVLVQDPFLFSRRTQVVDRAMKAYVPVLGWNRQVAESGAFISYGADNVAMFRRAAYYVDRILKGAKPGDLPVEQPTRFELVINMKSAKALGITVPQSMLLRADKVIE